MNNPIIKKLIAKKSASKESFRKLQEICGISNSHLSQIFKGTIPPPLESENFKKLLRHYDIPYAEETSMDEIDRHEGYNSFSLKENLVREIKKKSSFLHEEDVYNCIPAIVHYLVEIGYEDDFYEEKYPEANKDHFSLTSYFLKNETSDQNPFHNMGRTVRNYYWDYLSSFDNAIDLIKKMITKYLKRVSKQGSIYTIEYLDDTTSLMEGDPFDRDTEKVMMAYKSNKHFKEIVDSAIKLL